MIRKLARMVRDAWLILGLAALLLAFLEAGLSVALPIKDRLIRSQRSTADRCALADAYSDPSWVAKYKEEYRRSSALRWHPYVYWRRKAYSGDYINIDQAGVRSTIPETPPKRGAGPSLEIFIFGGSTVWGAGVRDAFTIPSILERELHDRGVPAEIINFGENGYVSTQEVITLLLELQQGRRPDLVIFYDGTNDMYSAYQQQIAGLPQNEFHRVSEFNLSQPLEWKRRVRMAFQDVASRLSIVRFITGLLRRTGVRRSAEVVAEGEDLPPDFPVPEGDALAREVVARYRSNVEIIRALAKHFHFKYRFYWQPTIFEKAHLSECEQREREKMQSLEEVFLRTDKVIQNSDLTAHRDYFFRDLSRIFAEVTEPLYVDWCHLSESGNERIARQMAGDVLGMLSADSSAP